MFDHYFVMGFPGSFVDRALPGSDTSNLFSLSSISFFALTLLSITFDVNGRADDDVPQLI